MVLTNRRMFEKGDRVAVAPTHPWMPERCGTVKTIETRIGNRIIVKFDNDELGMWHDDERDPVLRLGEKDLILLEERLNFAARPKSKQTVVRPQGGPTWSARRDWKRPSEH